LIDVKKAGQEKDVMGSDGSSEVGNPNSSTSGIVGGIKGRWAVVNVFDSSRCRLIGGGIASSSLDDSSIFLSLEPLLRDPALAVDAFRDCVRQKLKKLNKVSRSAVVLDN
jgi:hypothetical protein